MSVGRGRVWGGLVWPGPPRASTIPHTDHTPTTHRPHTDHTPTTTPPPTTTDHHPTTDHHRPPPTPSPSSPTNTHRQPLAVNLPSALLNRLHWDIQECRVQKRGENGRRPLIENWLVRGCPSPPFSTEMPTDAPGCPRTHLPRTSECAAREMAPSPPRWTDT